MTTKRTRVTMEDVAKAAQVTSQTVSRAFRNAPDISEETREKVLRVAAELNYVMNGTASSLRGGNSRFIVVVYDNLVNIYFSVMIGYLQQSLWRRGYSILMLSVAEAKLDGAAYEFAVSHNAAGIISFLEPVPRIGEMIETFSIPVLLIGRRTELMQVDYLRTNDEEGGRIAARHLFALGCKKAAYLTVPLEISCAYDRFSGFEEEAVRLGMERPLAQDAYVAPLAEILKALAESGVEGIFCFNDMIAYNALYTIEREKLPPLKVVGYDCVTREVHIPHELYSIGYDKQALAGRAAEIVVGRIEGKDEPRVTEVVEVEGWM